MALDGAFLRHLKHEIEGKLLDGRVDKIYQPNRDELVFSIRTREGTYKLLFSARANSARVNFINKNPENPKQPPMLCMLFRKKLQSARLLSIRQLELERALYFDFDSVNELGDHVILTLAVEIMGKYSNIILINEDGKIVDALKRVDAEMSSQRLVLPGMNYSPPPAQDKLNIFETDSVKLVSSIKEIPANKELSKALLSTLQGISPIVCRELQHQVGRGADLFIKDMDEEQFLRLGYFYQKLRETVSNTCGKPYMIVNKKPMDFSFLNIQQYSTSAVVKELSSFSELLNGFYEERDSIERMRVKEQDLLKKLSTMSERLSRKINNQRAELEQCKEREDYKVAGDLLSTYSYNVPPSATSVKLINYYDEEQGEISIKLDPSLTALQNAQKYYKEYKKAKTAEEKLREQIEIAQKELEYIDTVFDALARAESEKDLAEIKAELAEQGYTKAAKKKNRDDSISEPLRFTVADDFTVLVGRNNRQNDRLTMKIAKNYDVWFHTKNIPGSHTVLLSNGREPTEAAMEQAAELAAKHSRAKDSAQVPVDYTIVKNVSKPQGAKPGMVIYVNYKTMFVNPAE